MPPDDDPADLELPPREVLLGMLFNSVIIAVLAFIGNVAGLSVTGEELPFDSLVVSSVFIASFKAALYLARLRGITTHA